MQTLRFHECFWTTQRFTWKAAIGSFQPYPFTLSLSTKSLMPLRVPLLCTHNPKFCNKSGIHIIIFCDQLFTYKNHCLDSLWSTIAKGLYLQGGNRHQFWMNPCSTERITSTTPTFMGCINIIWLFGLSVFPRLLWCCPTALAQATSNMTLEAFKLDGCAMRKKKSC